jgi:hypothetical protein
MVTAAGENSKELLQSNFQMVRYIWLSYTGMKHMESGKRKPKSSASSSKKHSGPHFVICVKNEDYAASLELRKIYRYIPDKTASRLEMLRIIDESGEDYLYPSNYFVAIRLPRTVERAVSLAS